jgi:GGDEF domain-containing protein
MNPRWIRRCRPLNAAAQRYSRWSCWGDDGHPIQVTASFGIAASSPDMRPQQLLTQADKALYEAKACGRNSVRAYLAQAVRPAAGI